MGYTASLGQIWMGSEGQDFLVVVSCQSLADVEKCRKEIAADAQFQAIGAKLGPLLRAPTRFALIDWLIPQPK